MGEAGYTATGQMRWLEKPDKTVVLQQRMERTGWHDAWFDVPTVIEKPDREEVTDG